MRANAVADSNAVLSPAASNMATQNGPQDSAKSTYLPTMENQAIQTNTDADSNAVLSLTANNVASTERNAIPLTVLNELAPQEESANLTVSKKQDILSNEEDTHSILDNNEQYEDDIVIGRSVGAKHHNIAVRLPDGDVAMLTEGTRIMNAQTIAGVGRNRKVDMIDSLMLEFPESNEEKWQKKKGFGYIDYYGESYKAEIHWYEEPSVGQTDWKVKPDADGNWFYEGE